MDAAFRLFAPVCTAIIAELALERLRFNAALENEGINRYLRTFGLEPRRVHIDVPPGVGRAGEFNVYEVAAGAVPEL